MTISLLSEQLEKQMRPKQKTAEPLQACPNPFSKINVKPVLYHDELIVYNNESDIQAYEYTVLKGTVHHLLTFTQLVLSLLITVFC